MRAVFNAMGAILLGLSVMMLIPIPVSWFYGGGEAVSFLLGAVLTAAAGGGLCLAGRTGEELTLRGSFFLVATAWAMCGLFGALPFWIHGIFPRFTDAFFETVSGFTTTGATVLSADAVENLSHAFHFWRAFIQWLGGMGIIVLSVAILPMIQVGGYKLYQAEVPGLVKERVMPRIRETAKILWGVYFVITVVEVVLLWAGEMSFFDAVIHSFTTLATGGFSNQGSSVGAYQSIYVEGVIVVFMFISGANFLLHYRALSGRSLTGYFRDEEFRFYVTVVIVAAVIMTINLAWARGLEVPAALRQSIFQTVSVVTTTGFVTEDFGGWPVLSQVVLLSLMFFGGCGGSTGGSMKQARVLLLLKNARAQLYMSLHPQAVIPIHLNGQVVEASILGRVQAFFVLYLGLNIILVALCTAFGLDIISSISAVAASVGNVGPGLAQVGPTMDYGALPDALKWILSAGMIIGRLEVFTVLVLLQPAYWKKWG